MPLSSVLVSDLRSPETCRSETHSWLGHSLVHSLSYTNLRRIVIAAFWKNAVAIAAYG
ncbi:MAG: hypothetical protein GDA43_20865 [Hormoscilla sp. SP5CHS1]|nr:hypothetical protein [Hormoscilla sp. SP5CHS1]